MSLNLNRVQESGVHSSDADPRCLSRIPDPKTATKERGEEQFVVIPFFCSHKFHIVKNDFIFKMPKKNIWVNFQRIRELFTQKVVTKLSKKLVWDPGSEIRDPEKTYSGSWIQGSKRHRIPDPQHWFIGILEFSGKLS
jgi:hypothetical protein